jgi:hypothetical protein
MYQLSKKQKSDRHYIRVEFYTVLLDMGDNLMFGVTHDFQ